jgi:hypothetical protein
VQARPDGATGSTAGIRRAARDIEYFERSKDKIEPFGRSAAVRDR